MNRLRVASRLLSVHGNRYYATRRSISSTMTDAASSSSSSTAVLIDRIIDVIKSPNKSLMASRLEKLSSESDDASAVSPSLLASAMWKLVDTKAYADVTIAFEWIGDHPLVARNDSALHAALKAYGVLRRPKQVTQAATRLHDPALAPQTASLMLEAFCLSDRLDLAEGLLANWLHRYSLEQSVVSGHVVHASIRRCLDSMKISQEHVVTNDKDSSLLSSFPSGAEAHLCSTLPSQEAWRAVMRMLGGRSAWRPCIAVMELLEELAPFRFPSVEVAGISVVGSEAEQVPRIISADAVVYHHVVRALCSCGQTTLAFEIVDKMRLKGVQPGVALCSHLYETVVASIPLEADAEFERMADRVIQFLLTCGASPKKYRASDHQLFGLVSVLVTSLCKRNYIQEAERALEMLTEKGVAYGHGPILTMIHAHSIRGDWRKALALYEKVSVKVTNQQGESFVLPPPSCQKVFHHICGGLRRAGEVDELARLMLQHSPQFSIEAASKYK